MKIRGHPRHPRFPSFLNLAETVMSRCNHLAKASEEPTRLTRTFASPAMRAANALVGGWMRDAGGDARVDAALNLLARWPSPRRGARTLLLGSHLDTVRDAGKYDGPLGVLVALAAMEHLQAGGVPLPFHVEIAGFSDEEGVRYQTTYLGSRALAGTLTKADLARVEEQGIERARRKRGEFLAYAEVHIEQGPVLEERDLAVGVVSGIAGQSRVRVEFAGMAGHAGTVPMAMRRDALCAAAEFVLAVEKCGVTATVGQISAEPGASNVIPGRAVLTLDVRDVRDARRMQAVKRLRAQALAIAKRRGVQAIWTPVQETGAVACDAGLTKLMRAAVASRQREVVLLPSGAGHDAAAMSAVCPVAMLFVRCQGGVSHHPAESVKTEDVACAIAVLVDFVQLLAKQYG